MDLQLIMAVLFIKKQISSPTSSVWTTISTKKFLYRHLLEEMVVLCLVKTKSGAIFLQQALPGVFQKKIL